MANVPFLFFGDFGVFPPYLFDSIDPIEYRGNYFTPPVEGVSLAKQVQVFCTSLKQGLMHDGDPCLPPLVPAILAVVATNKKYN